MLDRKCGTSIESLETRTLFSHVADDPIIIADRATIAEHKALYVEHRQGLKSTLSDDIAGIHEARHQRLLDCEPLKQQLRDDLAAGKQELLDDRNTLIATLNDDKSNLLGLREAIHQHRGDVVQIAIDLSNFTTARDTRSSHLQAGRDTIIQHKLDLKNTLTDDKLAIRSFLTTASAGMIAATQKYDDDLSAGEAELADDRDMLNNDVNNLNDDMNNLDDDVMSLSNSM